MNKFQIDRVKYMIAQAENQSYVQMSKGDADILRTLLESPEKWLEEMIKQSEENSGVNHLKLVEDKADTFEEMLDKVNKGEKL